MYFAKQYTAHPDIGWLTPGETLSEEQVKKLGMETIGQLIDRGVIGSTGTEQVKPDSETVPETEKEPDNKPVSGTEQEQVKPDSETEPDEDEELPELEITGEMVGEPETEPEAPKKKGRGKRS